MEYYKEYYMDILNGILHGINIWNTIRCVGDSQKPLPEVAVSHDVLFKDF
jgi:hypothetical protein